MTRLLTVCALVLHLTLNQVRLVLDAIEAGA